MAKTVSSKDKKTNDIVPISKEDLEELKKEIVVDVKEVFKDEISRINFPRKSYFWKIVFLIIVIMLITGYFVVPNTYKQVFNKVKDRFKAKPVELKTVKEKEADNKIALDSEKVVNLYNRVKVCNDETGDNYYLKSNIRDNIDSKMLISCSVAMLPKDKFINTGVNYQGRDILKLELDDIKLKMNEMFEYQNFDPFVNMLKVNIGSGEYLNINYDPLNNHYTAYQLNEENKIMNNYYIKLIEARDDLNEITLVVQFIVTNYKKEINNEEYKINYEIYKDFTKDKLVATEKEISGSIEDIKSKLNIEAYIESGRKAAIIFTKKDSNYIFKESKLL